MQSDIHDLSSSDERVTVRLRVDQFTLMTRALGCETDLARAELIGVTPRTIRRARAGIIGEEFMTKTVAALQRHEEKLAALNLRPSLDELFEVCEAGDPS